MGTLIPVCSIATGQQKAPAAGRGFFWSYEYSTGAPLLQQHPRILRDSYAYFNNSSLMLLVAAGVVRRAM